MRTPEALGRAARDEGLDLVGAVPVGPSPFWDAYAAWVAAGNAADMSYLVRPDAVERRKDPRRIMPTARSVLVVGASYAGPPRPTLPALHGRVSRYAWGPPPLGDRSTDYHHWVLRRLQALVERIAAEVAKPLTSRSYVDTGPVLERAWAQAAGLGWAGKNTNLIHPRLGSYLFLGVALLSVDLPTTPQSNLPGCGQCRRCIEACPTRAIVAPRVIDARRCLSYLTIEHRGPIPMDLRGKLGARVFGCDTCQSVCPWNRRPIAVCADRPVPALATLPLLDLLTLDDAAFRARFRQTAIWRATPEGLARNAAVVLGNLVGHTPLELQRVRSALDCAAVKHPSALVREHAAWARANC